MGNFPITCSSCLAGKDSGDGDYFSLADWLVSEASKDTPDVRTPRQVGDRECRERGQAEPGPEPEVKEFEQPLAELRSVVAHIQESRQLRAEAAAYCVCGADFTEDSRFCRMCGVPRPAAGAAHGHEGCSTKTPSSTSSRPAASEENSVAPHNKDATAASAPASVEQLAAGHLARPQASVAERGLHPLIRIGRELSQQQSEADFSDAGYSRQSSSEFVRPKVILSPPSTSESLDMDVSMPIAVTGLRLMSPYAVLGHHISSRSGSPCPPSRPPKRDETAAA